MKPPLILLAGLCLSSLVVGCGGGKPASPDGGKTSLHDMSGDMAQPDQGNTCLATGQIDAVAGDLGSDCQDVCYQALLMNAPRATLLNCSPIVFPDDGGAVDDGGSGTVYQCNYQQFICGLD